MSWCGGCGEDGNGYRCRGFKWLLRMNVAVLGGTGDIGEGIALRLAGTEHDVFVGSRDEDRGRDAAEEYSEVTGSEFWGGSNREAVKDADAVLVCVPYRYAVQTVGDVVEWVPEDASVISPVVCMERDSFFRYMPPEEGSATQEIRRVVPESNAVAGAFHNVSSARLTDLDDSLGMDILVFGEDEAKEDAFGLVDAIDGLHGLDAGGLGVAPQVEAITPLLINVGSRNDIEHPGVKFV